MARVVLIEYPGSSVEEVANAYALVTGETPQVVWHESDYLPQADLLVIPGGSSFCDYLRPGALAKSSASAQHIRRFARSGRVLGIGNGFQVLCELGLLPGALISNAEAKFLSQSVSVTEVENSSALAPKNYRTERFQLACESGRFHADNRLLGELETNKQIVFLYTDENGLQLEAPPTGSVRGIAGISNGEGNILGVMFHPERSVEERFGGVGGRQVLLSALS